MKLVLISDTHTKHDMLYVPDGDVIIHAGDATWTGKPSEIETFNFWFSNLPHKVKIFVPGNHDKLFERNHALARSLLSDKITYLEDNGCYVDGVFIWGSPWTPRFGHDWAFQGDPGDHIESKWAKIPDFTNILITHGPPFGIGDCVPAGRYSTKDLFVGCPSLLKRTEQLADLKLHVFGHIHEGRGTYGKYVNASSIDGEYKNVFAPIVLDI